MNSLSDIILIFVVLVNLTLLGSGRLTSCIKQVAAQGMVLGVLPLLVLEHGFQMSLVTIAVVSFTLKGLVFPRLLLRSQREADVRHEVAPIVGYAASILFGIVILALSFWMAASFELPPELPVVSNLVLPVALSTLLCGLFLIVSRRQALMQVIGYLVLENGIYICGVALAHEEPLLVEMGILLDVFVAVFVMGIAMFHISREFDHISVDQLTQLRD